MSPEENPKDESDSAQKIHDAESKQVKDRKNRKEKVKPLAKVMCFIFPILITCHFTSM